VQEDWPDLIATEKLIELVDTGCASCPTVGCRRWRRPSAPVT